MQSSQDLLDGLRRGDSEAVEAAFEVHGRMVYHVCLSRLKDETKAKDAAQTVFITLMRKQTVLSEETLLASWLYRTSLFVCQGMWRKERLRQKYEKEALEWHFEDRESSRDIFPHEKIKPLLEGIFLSLPEKYRKPMTLTFLDGLSTATAAETLGVPAGTLRSQVSRGVSILKRKLGNTTLAMSYE